MTSTAELYELDLEAQCNAIWSATLAEEQRLQRIRDTPPALFVFDGHQRLQHLLLDCTSLKVEDVENDTGSIELVIPADHPVAQWMADDKGRMQRGEGEFFHIDVEKNGVRVTGRYEEKTIGRDSRGRRVLRVTLLTDYENLKWIDCWSNPWLPAIFQFPRVFILAGPSIWVLKTALHVNLARINGIENLVALDDPLTLGNLLGLDQSEWDVVVAPTSFSQDMAAGTSWCLFFSRWGRWHDRSKMIMEDAELSVVTRRWRLGDPEPWPGADLKDGALVVDIVDKSGQMEGTANGGSVWDGLTRTFREFSADFVEETDTELNGEPSWPTSVFADMLRTEKGFPFVHFPADMMIDTDYTTTPAKGVMIGGGGQSAPGVNDLIDAGIQAVGDVIGHNLGVMGYGIGPFGGALSALLMPFVKDTVLAWMHVPLPWRIQQSGSSHYYEFHVDLPGKAYTLSSLLAIRTAIVKTKRRKKAKVKFGHDGPYTIGWPGTGHMYKGDRGSFEVFGDTRREIHVERAKKANLEWEAGHFAQWELEFGAPEEKDPLEELIKDIQEAFSALSDLGVF